MIYFELSMLTFYVACVLVFADEASDADTDDGDSDVVGGKL